MIARWWQGLAVPRMTEIRQKMHTEIEGLWLTDEMQILKPTVIDEVGAGPRNRYKEILQQQ